MFGLYAENDPSKICPVFARVRIQAPHAFSQKLIPRDFFLHVLVLCRGGSYSIVPGTNPHPFQGQTGQNGDLTVELNIKEPVCPRDGSRFVPGTGPGLSPGAGPGLSQGRVQFVPNTVPPQNVYVYWFFSCPSSKRLHRIPRFGVTRN